MSDFVTKEREKELFKQGQVYESIEAFENSFKLDEKDYTGDVPVPVNPPEITVPKQAKWKSSKDNDTPVFSRMQTDDRVMYTSGPDQSEDEEVKQDEVKVTNKTANDAVPGNDLTKEQRDNQYEVEANEKKLMLYNAVLEDQKSDDYNTFSDKTKSILDNIRKLNAQNPDEGFTEKAEIVAALEDIKLLNQLVQDLGKVSMLQIEGIKGDELEAEKEKRLKDLFKDYETKYGITEKEIDILSFYATAYKESMGNLVYTDKEYNANNVEAKETEFTYDKVLNKPITKKKTVVKNVNGVEVKTDVTTTYNHKKTVMEPLVSPLFVREPSVSDIKQGDIGDCYFISAINAIAEKDPQFFKDCMKDNGDTVTVRFYDRDNKPLFITVKKSIPKTVYYNDNGEEYEGRRHGAGCYYAANWVALLEKAFVAARKYVESKDKADQIEDDEDLNIYSDPYEKISGGRTEDIIPALLGRDVKISRTKLVKAGGYQSMNNSASLIFKNLRDNVGVQAKSEYERGGENKYTREKWNLDKAKLIFGIDITEGDKNYEAFNTNAVFNEIDTFIEDTLKNEFNSTRIKKDVDLYNLIDKLIDKADEIPDFQLEGYTKEQKIDMFKHYMQAVKKQVANTNKVFKSINTHRAYFREEEEHFNAITTACKSGKIVLAGTSSTGLAEKKGSGQSSGEKVVLGVASNHAYIIKDTLEEEHTFAGKTIKQKFVVIVNPWKSKIRKYDENGIPYMAEAKEGYDPKGTFKMELSDFISTFDDYNIQN